MLFAYKTEGIESTNSMVENGRHERGKKPLIHTAVLPSKQDRKTFTAAC